MSRTIPGRVLVVLAACMLVLGATAGVAAAHHKDKHDKGGKPAGAGKPAPDERSNHPSGKNREQNPGPADDEQGKSPSDPDGMENGGPDKPGGSGGVYDWDQDGNNGCGNDTDFEDDNNGNCGGPEKVRAARTCPRALPEQASRGKGNKRGHAKRAAMCEVAVEATAEGTDGTGGTAGAGRIGSGSPPPAEDAAEVLGLAIGPSEDVSVAPATQSRDATAVAAPLALTGEGPLGWIVLALVLAGSGALLLAGVRYLPRVSRRH